MKTMQELYDEIIASRKLKAQFLEAAKAGKTEAFLKEHGCEATMEQVAAFMKEKVSKDLWQAQNLSLRYPVMISLRSVRRMR